MYRVSKVLNNNGVIAIEMEENQEYVLLGKGIGFGKKVSQRFEAPSDCTRYSLKNDTERGSAASLVKSVDPVFWEIANEVLKEAEHTFGNIDKRILFPLADHISFAVARMKNGEQISNPLTGDIHALFYKEFQVASVLKKVLSVAMQMARTVRECVSIIETETGKKIDVMTLDYNRLMNHVKYMAARLLRGEELKVNINDYIEIKFPKAFAIATTVCDHLGENIGVQPGEREIGYLALHIEGVYNSGESD